MPTLQNGSPRPFDQCARVAVRREHLPGGDAGIHRTVMLMRELVRAARGTPIVRAHAERAVAGVRAGDLMAETVAVRDYLAALVDYRRDPHRVEWLQVPGYVFACQIERGRRPQLDCDDLTMLALSPLEALGHHTAFRIVSHRADGQYNHVYGLDITNPGEAIKVDLVDAWRPLGRDAPAETRAYEVAVD